LLCLFLFVFWKLGECEADLRLWLGLGSLSRELPRFKRLKAKGTDHLELKLQHWDAFLDERPGIPDLRIRVRVRIRALPKRMAR